LYTCSIWYCHSLRAVVVAGRYTDWVRTTEDEDLWLETCRGMQYYVNK